MALKIVKKDQVFFIKINDLLTLHNIKKYKTDIKLYCSSVVTMINPQI